MNYQTAAALAKIQIRQLKAAYLVKRQPYKKYKKAGGAITSFMLSRSRAPHKSTM